MWKIGAFDLACGAIALAGLVFWAFAKEPTVALVSFVCADQVAGLPTLRKSWLAPSTESSRVFVMGSINCIITVLTLKVITTAGVLFPGCVAISDFLLATLIISRAGPRFRGRQTRHFVSRGLSNERYFNAPFTRELPSVTVTKWPRCFPLTGTHWCSRSSSRRVSSITCSSVRRASVASLSTR